ncbi:MAG: UDP-glucose/GDP-mannose dehydrogenase family protein [Elusimicrobiota bacterium]|jgi:UDPglucose 6-dehydrogenase|nr:UDP-glucose/GDP-mannose dehydrogenase family protein [Elusimicrobiota bacterium]
MKVAIIGTGYVGLPTGVGLAELGHDVVCIDRDKTKIDDLKNGKVTLFEDGLENLLKKNLKEKKIKFTTSMPKGLYNAEIIIIAVGTPPHPVTKEADMKYIHAAATEIIPFLDKYTLIATKSTVPVGTGDDIESLIKNRNPKAFFDVISLPEFLREGFAVQDFFNPDRIIVGTNSNRPINVIEKLYAPLKYKTNFVFVSRRSAETIKYAANAFLAIKIHYINEIADFCEKANANIYEVAKGIGSDKRIGDKFLNPGPGYGGSCFPKDTMAMAFMGKMNEVDLSLIETTIKNNHARKIKMAEKIIDFLKDIKKREDEIKIAVWGLTFKGNTDDCRESPSMEIIDILLKHPYSISAYDPQGMENAKKILVDKIKFAKDEYDATKNADILVVLTDWGNFEKIDLKKVKKLMSNYKILDLRNMINRNEAINLGFSYVGIGR